MVQADGLVLIRVVTLGNHKKIGRKICVPEERSNTFDYITGVEIKDLAPDDNLGTREFGTTRQLFVDDFVEFWGTLVRQSQGFGYLIS